ncbi:ATP-binding protein [Streptomyces sp. NPDC058653]|uniref:sensor histidine kinase n=1 Tax=Streptomyces sp. NPDC058653 TaxID=3346576 RepID=UPI0036684847
MSVPVTPSPHRVRGTRPLSLAGPPALLLVAGVAAGAAAATAPAAARGWVVTTLVVAWAVLASVVAGAVLTLRRQGRASTTARAEIQALHAQLARNGAESTHLVNVTLPGVVKRLRDGASAEETLATTPAPADPQLQGVLRTFAAEVALGEHRVSAAVAERQTAVARLGQVADDLDLLSTVTLPTALGGLRQGRGADTVLADLKRPSDPRLRVLTESIVRDFAVSERRGAAARTAGAKALSRVQAKAVSMLADLREMQERHGEEVFGDLLRLDHNTSQLGLMTDRLALLMGGRGSRAWNRPIGMESILRGAVGRIAAYQRVRLHCSSTAAVAGFAAEGVMHLLAELMDNAANFSPPIDEVHVYVEERSAGIVVTIEDSGLKMPDAAMRRAEESVSGRANDLATLQGTRLGLAVVGRLAEKYNLSVNFRPSSRGGTGVVVLFPPQLLAQPRSAADRLSGRHAAPAKAPTAPRRAVAPRRPELPSVPLPSPAAPVDGPRVATPGGLPVRPPGRTMAAADRDRAPTDDTGGTGGPGERDRTRDATAAPKAVPPGRDAGTRFDAFHRSRHPVDGAPGKAGPEPGHRPGPRPGSGRGPDPRPESRSGDTS